MPLQETSGNSTQDAYGGGAAVIPNYIEDVFSTYLWTGTGAANTINNGIDLAGSGGLTWIKSRSNSKDNALTDTVRGTNSQLMSNLTNAPQTNANMVTAFNSNGFTLGTDATNGWVNLSGLTYVGWTFRKQAKFFDVVTFTTDLNGYALVSHNLGSTPAFVITKTTSSGASDWACYHKDLNGGVNPGRYIIRLNKTNAANNPVGANNWIVPTSTTLEFPAGIWLQGNTTFVAYLFASNAGGFGLTGTDNVITCGSFTPSSGNATVNLGYEPQFVLIKNSEASDNWQLLDTMRGWDNTNYAKLFPNTSDAESVATNYYVKPTSTGFNITNFADQAYIYIAIRRGPMKVPTDATKVFSPVLYTGNASTKVVTGLSFSPDLLMGRRNAASGDATAPVDRLRGVTQYLYTSAISAEQTTPSGNDIISLDMDGFTAGPNYNASYNFSASEIAWSFKRAPSFFDEVCFTSASGTQNHNLGVAPELVILKSRSTVDSWYVFAAQNGFGQLNSTSAWGGLGNGSGLGVNLANVTSTTLSAFSGFFGVGVTSVAYLFATCAGVSKVGTYTGNGTTQAIACGFTGGARFVLIKRTDSTGDWYVYDTARGMTTLTDPYLLLNSTAAETATLGSVTSTTGGFTVNAAILAAINTSSASYIFLAIA